MVKKLDLSLSLLVLIVGLLLLFCNDYMKEKSYNSTYIGYVHKEARYKSNSYIEGVFKLDSGLIVNRTISSGFYLLVKPGDIHILKLKEIDINQSALNNFLFFFLPILLIGSGLFRILFTEFL